MFSIEHVRLIVTADMVIIPRDGYEKRPNNIAFVDRLDDCIAEGVQVMLCPLLDPGSHSFQSLVLQSGPS